METNISNRKLKTILKAQPKWTSLLPEDPRLWLLNSKESFTVYRTLKDLLNLNASEPIVKNAKQEMLNDPLVINSIDNLPDWETEITKSHDRPQYLPNQLWLLFDWGLLPEDHPKIEKAVDKILTHQDNETGQFMTYMQLYFPKPRGKEVGWGSLLCDHNLITSLFLLSGKEKDPTVKTGFERMSSLIVETTQGYGWKCVKELTSNWHGPGRVDDACPMIIIDALRGCHVLPDKDRPEHLLEAGITLLNCWTNRSSQKLFMFGHGRNFRNPKPPFFWYNIGTVLDAASHYPELVKTVAFREMTAVSLLAFNEGIRTIPKSIKTFFNDFSFGQKKEPSPWLTFFLCRILKRAADADPEFVKKVKKLDGTSFRGSKGGPKPAKLPEIRNSKQIRMNKIQMIQKHIH